MKVIMNDEAFAKKGFTISTNPDLLDVDVIYNYLDKESYWAKGIPLDTFKKSLANSLCFGIYKDNKQVGLARLITDKATFAYLCDVFILEDYRGHGLSKWLMQTIRAHPDLQGLRRWSLATADAHGLYEQFGFSPLAKPQVWMEVHAPYSQNTNKEK
jgi:N-acetylglutamate synthase-like GNAT family acetyltransferase